MTEVLQPGYAVRAPRPEEVQAVADLIIATDLMEYGHADYSVEELTTDWRELDLNRDAWIVVAPDGALAGYGSIWDRGKIRIDADVYVHPEQMGRGVGTHLVRVTEARAREFVPLAPPDARVVLNNYINAANQAATDLLLGEGYRPVRYFLRMLIDLDAPPAAPAWPPGIEVRAYATDDDKRRFYAASAEAMRDHWGHVPLSFEEWEKANTVERFEPGLWFLAVDGDEPAGVAIGDYYLEMGWVRTLAVRRPWRQRGLGTALLRHAFGEFYRRGRRQVGLGVDADSPTGATRLYERAGMRVGARYATFEKEMRPGNDPSAP